MYCNRRSLVFYDVIVLLVIVLLLIVLLLSVMMNGCGFSHWSYQVFHLPYVAAIGVDLTIPLLKRFGEANPDAVTRRNVLNLQ
jgi:hypothetical protein